MENAWRERAHERFWERLVNQSVDDMISNQKYLRSLRNDWEAMTNIHKTLGQCLKSRGIDLMSLIMKASVPANLALMDEEDDEKMQSLSVNPYLPREILREDMPVYWYTESADWCPKDVLEVILAFARLKDPSPPCSEPDCSPQYDSNGDYGHFGVEMIEPTFSPCV